MQGPSRRPLAAALFALVAVASCAGVAAPPADSAPSPSAQAAPPPVRRANPADVEFINGMIHHHAQALVMSEWARTHGESPAVRTLAERIHVSQTDEIGQMQQWLADMGEPVPEPSPQGMPMTMGGVEHHHLMSGMLTPEQLARLERARGAEFDRLFLAYMIQHHEGALEMVETLFAAHGGGIDDFIYKVASDTFADQGSEIDRMQRLLDAMDGAR
jgi:uncharacterized protein (DUF305 family)